MSLWLLRNWGWFAPLMLAVFLALGALIVQLRAAQQREHATQLREREQHRERLVQELQRVYLTDHANRWSDQARDLVRRAAAINPEDVQAHATVTLIGPDAVQGVTMDGFSASSVAIDATGKRLLFGGWDDQPASIRYVDGGVACPLPCGLVQRP